MKLSKAIPSIIAAFLSLSLLGACAENSETLDSAAGETSGNAASEGTRLADSLTITEATLGNVIADYENNSTLPLLDAKLEEKDVSLTFTGSQADQNKQVERIIGDVLMEISKRTVDSKELEDGYATVYDHYNVYVKVVDDQQEKIMQGEMPAGSQKISWEN
ncbi:hypothetical protein [Pseudalkalibacillus caeni]|uniref:Lipoprotein n=1 Tax=Exobacillus caeni TaxID=2574798 RepID=A0A5R9F0P3_9BACL|nr:hypothetical protein [Pseudalkalibacillus caeni]TLS37202.1 hypothetical protein FCL54_11795 [Pseudalkalibacillus caeni]